MFIIFPRTSNLEPRTRRRLSAMAGQALNLERSLCMFFIPLSQPESVDLVIHALRAAAGDADCSSCPVRKVCMKQCLTIAVAVERMVQAGTLPALGIASSPDLGPPKKTGNSTNGKGGLKVIK
jgi:hypothetical protein